MVDTGDELLWRWTMPADALQDTLLDHRRRTAKALVNCELDIVFVPLMNPDGNHHALSFCKNIGRKNGRDLHLDGRFSSGEGVDLNRNYPFRWELSR